MCFVPKEDKSCIINANMESKTEQLVVSFLLADYECVRALPKTCRICPTGGNMRGDYMQCLFQLWLSQCSAEEGTNSSGNNLGLDRLSNLFIEGVPSQQTYLPTSTSISYLLTRAATFSFHILWMIRSETPVTGGSEWHIEKLAVPFGCDCTWSCQYTVSIYLTRMKSGSVSRVVILTKKKLNSESITKMLSVCVCVCVGRGERKRVEEWSFSDVIGFLIMGNLSNRQGSLLQLLHEEPTHASN